jgi:hypothetical protein
MRKLGFMLLAIGLFASYGTYTLIEYKRFKYRNTHITATAEEDPEGYKGTLHVAMSLSIIGIVGGIFCLVKSRKT